MGALDARKAASRMTGRVFADFVDEVAVRVSVALALVGDDDTYEACVGEVSGCAGGSGALDGTVSRTICFEDGRGRSLPVYVSCGSDGLSTAVAEGEEGETVSVAPPRSLDQSDDLVRDVVAAIEGRRRPPTLN